MTAVFLVLADVNRLDDRPEYQAHVRDRTDLATYLGTVENGQAFGSLAGDAGVGSFVLADAATSVQRFVSVFVGVYVLLILVYVITSWIPGGASPTLEPSHRASGQLCGGGLIARQKLNEMKR